MLPLLSWGKASEAGAEATEVGTEATAESAEAVETGAEGHPSGPHGSLRGRANRDTAVRSDASARPRQTRGSLRRTVPSEDSEGLGRFFLSAGRGGLGRIVPVVGKGSRLSFFLAFVS